MILVATGRGMGDILPEGCSHIEMETVCEPHPETGVEQCYKSFRPVCGEDNNFMTMKVKGIPVLLLVASGLLVLSSVIGGSK